MCSRIHFFDKSKTYKIDRAKASYKNKTKLKNTLRLRRLKVKTKNHVCFFKVSEFVHQQSQFTLKRLTCHYE